MSRLRRPELAFAAVAALFGTVFTFVLPALGGYDEPLHFLRAWQVSDGGVFAREARPGDPVRADTGDEVGAYVPSALVRDMRAILREGAFDAGDAGDVYRRLGDPTPRGPREFVAFSSAAVYSPVSYLPSAVALRVGRGLHLSTLALILFGRLANVAAFVALVALAIRRLPSRRWVLAVVALAPVAVFQAATFSADTVTLALALLVVAQALHLTALDSDRVRPALLGETALATVALGLAKQPYLLVATLLLVPLWRHRGRIGMLLGASLGLSVALAVAWSRWARARYVPPELEAARLDPTMYAYRGVDPDRQLEHVRANPIDFLAAIGRTIRRDADHLLPDALGQIAWWRPPVLLVAATLALVVVAYVWDGGPVAGGRPAMVLAAAVATVVAGAVFLLGYLGWNEVGAPRIDALQGRYLFPVVALLAVATLPSPSTRLAWRDAERTGPALVGASAVVLAAVVIGITVHFYR